MKNILHKQMYEWMDDYAFDMTELKQAKMYLIGGVANCVDFLDTSLQSNLNSGIKYSTVNSNNAEIMANVLKKYSFEQLNRLI